MKWYSGDKTVELEVADQTAAALATQAISAQTAAYTLALTDAGKLVEVTAATGVALTVPPDSAVPFLIGTRLDVLQGGVGLVTITAGAGVTVHQSVGTLKLAGQWALASLVKIAADTWVASGELSAT